MGSKLSIAIVRYAETTVVESRFFAFLQVEQPDFLVEPNVSAQQVGSSVAIKGQSSNAGLGLYHSYAEVRVFHPSDFVNPVWVGTLSATIPAPA